MKEQKESTVERDNFVALAKALVSVPKKEIDKRLEAERQEKASKNAVRKRRS
jgi:hypothetical protein